VAVDPDRRGDAAITRQGELALHVAAPGATGSPCCWRPASSAHLQALGAVAQSRGLTLDEGGLRKSGTVLARAAEAEIYEALGLAFIPPELRETGEEVRLGQTGDLPELVDAGGLRGVLHAHTIASDGSDTLEDMACAPLQRGYAYLGLTDHSQTAHYAGGLKAERVALQQGEIDRLNRRWRSRELVRPALCERTDHLGPLLVSSGRYFAMRLSMAPGRLTAALSGDMALPAPDIDMRASRVLLQHRESEGPGGMVVSQVAGLERQREAIAQAWVECIERHHELLAVAREGART